MRNMPSDLTRGVYEPEAHNLYAEPERAMAAAAYGFETVCGEHGLRDKTLALDPVADELARANAEYWAARGVATIRRNDRVMVRKLAVEHLDLQHNSAYWRACTEERRAMAVERRPQPAEVIPLQELRRAREAAVAAAAQARIEAERARLQAHIREGADGQLEIAL